MNFFCTFVFGFLNWFFSFLQDLIKQYNVLIEEMLQILIYVVGKFHFSVVVMDYCFDRAGLMIFFNIDSIERILEGAPFKKVIQ